VNTEVGPLLSSVSLMLAAFGFFYTTQRDRIDATIADKDVPDAGTKRTTMFTAAKKVRNSTAVLGIAALVVWLLLLDEIEDRAAAAIDDFSLDKYSTPDAIFFVAANAWLLVAIYIAGRWWKLRGRVDSLQPPP
jgi:hypothetical protein